MSDEFTQNNGVSLEKKPQQEDYGAPQQSVEQTAHDTQQAADGYSYGAASENTQQTYAYGQPQEQSAYSNGSYDGTQQTAYQQAYNNGQYYGQAQAKGTGTGFGIASLVLGIISIFTFACCINYILAILAIIFGIVQIVKNEKKGLAIAGIIMGAISIIIAIIFTLGVAGAAIGSKDAESMLQDYLQEYENMQEDSF